MWVVFKLQGYKDTVRCGALGAAVPGHLQGQLSQTLIAQPLWPPLSDSLAEFAYTRRLAQNILHRNWKPETFTVSCWQEQDLVLPIKIDEKPYGF